MRGGTIAPLSPLTQTLIETRPLGERECEQLRAANKILVRRVVDLESAIAAWAPKIVQMEKALRAVERKVRATDKRSREAEHRSRVAELRLARELSPEWAGDPPYLADDLN